jgi:histidyl-tRNA synthetase
MRDFLPEDVRRRQHVIDVIADVYQRYGFEPLETPAVENIETLLGKYGEEGDKLIFKILRRGDLEAAGGADLALRYDLTVPLARVVAEHRARLPRFFKRYQVQPVWRADRPQKGRFREFYQCDVDAIGSKSMIVEAELLSAACDVFTELGFADFALRLNHRRLLSGILEARGVPAAHHGDVLVELDKLDKVGFDAVHDTLTARGLAEAADAVRVLARYGKASAVETRGAARSLQALEALGEWREASTGFSVAFRELGELLRLLQSTSAEARVALDTSLARGLSYYTGAIFEVAVPDLSGSLAGGGRYDDLIGMFLGEQVPACGISLGLERILVVMGERAMFPASLATTSADVMITQWDAERRADTLRLAAQLRSAGLRVDVYPEADKIGKQFKYASARGVRFVLVVGDDEEARGEVAVKDLQSGEQTAVPRAEVAAHIRARTPTGAEPTARHG